MPLASPLCLTSSHPSAWFAPAPALPFLLPSTATGLPVETSWREFIVLVFEGQGATPSGSRPPVPCKEGLARLTGLWFPWGQGPRRLGNGERLILGTLLGSVAPASVPCGIFLPFLLACCMTGKSQPMEATVLYSKGGCCVKGHKESSREGLQVARQRVPRPEFSCRSCR